MKTKHMGITVFCGLGVLLACGVTLQAADGTWTNAAGGSWGVTGNWQGGVAPNNGHAYLTLTGVNYTVTYDSAGVAISNLVVYNGPANQTTLTMSQPFSHVGGSIILSTNALVNVTNNALWTYGGTLPNATTVLQDLCCGADLEVCGGIVQFTNLQRSAWISWNTPTVQVGGNASTGTLRVTSGQFNCWTTDSAAKDSHIMYVGRGTKGNGTLYVGAGTSVKLGGAGDITVLYLGSEGGRGTATVAGDLAFANAAEPKIGFTHSITPGGYGDMTITNGGRLLTSGKPKVGVDGSCYGILRLSGTNLMSNPGSGWNSLYAGNCQNVAGTSTGVVQLTSGSILVSGAVEVGLAQGANMAAVGTMSISGGQATFQTGNNAWIGAAGGAGNAQGTLNMSGGSLFIDNGANGVALVYPPGVSPSYGYSMAGLIIGQIGAGTGNTDDTNPSSTALGTLNLSGGVITNQYQLVIGCNGATGVVNQTGGAMIHVLGGGSSDTTNTITIIGYSYGTNSNPRGGNGTYNMAGGTYTTPRMVFVGGVPTNIEWFARGGAVGLLKVTGGSFTVNNTLYVGENGNGTVTMGSNGTLTVGNLYATNATSKLRFELGPSGIGTLTVTNELRVSASTKLEVNLSGFPPAASTRLMHYKTCTGTIAPANITITGGSATIDQRGTDLYLRQVIGTAVFVQ